VFHLKREKDIVSIIDIRLGISNELRVRNQARNRRRLEFGPKKLLSAIINFMDGSAKRLHANLLVYLKEL